MKNPNNNYNRFEKNQESTKNQQIKARKLPFGIAFPTLTGGAIFWMGLIFFIVGMFFVLIFGQFTNIGRAKVSDSDPITQGELTDVIETNAEINDVSVFEYKYKYTINDSTYTGSSYHTGYIEIPNIVDVQFNVLQPEVSRIKGMRQSSMGSWIIFLLAIFPLIGGIMVIVTVKNGIRRLKILKYGKLAKGKFVRKEATDVTINDQRVYKMFFKFTADDGNEYTCFDKTHKTWELEDEEFELLVYDPRRPSEAVLLDTLPARVRRFFTKNNDDLSV